MPTITLGNPITITSGQMSTIITRNSIRIEKLYWLQPGNTNGSGIVLRKKNLSGPLVATMLAEVSGQSQIMQFNDSPLNVNDLYCEIVGTGTLYIHTK